jgi:glycosyltransferase involved in cell wall biosynthesis
LPEFLFRNMASEIPLLTIVICTYNRAKFLPDCLDSIAHLQGNKAEFEALIVNNNSTDSTPAIIEQYIELYPTITFRAVLELKQGLSNARNRGVLEARGKYIAFVDDDAIVHPDYLQELKKFVTLNPEIMGFGGKILPVYVDGPEPKWMNPYSRSLFLSEVNYGDQIKRLTKDTQYPFGCNMVIKSDYFRQYESFDSAIGPMSKDGGRCDDKVLFLNMRARHFPVYYVPTLQVTHQIDTTRLTPTYIRKLSEGLGFSLKLLAKKEGHLATFRRSWDVVYKFVAACVLALGYVLMGRIAVASHLIQFRWWVLTGFFKA